MNSYNLIKHLSRIFKVWHKLLRLDKSAADVYLFPFSLSLLQLFRKLILACLNQAMKDGATSICFPTIGTGYLMYKPDVSAKNMFQAISDFASNNPSSAINIYIVIRNSEDSLRKNLKASVNIKMENNSTQTHNAPYKRSRVQCRKRQEDRSQGLI